MSWNQDNPRFKRPREMAKPKKRKNSKRGVEPGEGYWAKLIKKISEAFTGPRGRGHYPPEAQTSDDIDAEDFQRINAEILNLEAHLGDMPEPVAVQSPPADETRPLFESAEEQDLPPSIEPASPHGRKFLRLAIWVVVGACIITGGYYGLNRYFEERHKELDAVAPRLDAPILPPAPAMTPGPMETYAAWQATQVEDEVEIKSGSSLWKAFENLKLPNEISHPVMNSLAGHKEFEMVKPGAKVKAVWANQSRAKLLRLEYTRPNGGRPYLIIPSGEDKYAVVSQDAAPVSVKQVGYGVVEDTLWGAGEKGGLDANMIMNLAGLLASDVDFLSEIRKGDTFHVLYEREYLDGAALGQGKIKMVRMVNDGRAIEYYHYISPDGKNDGYYDANGNSSNKQFFVSPLQVTRITSGYSLKRLHPIHKVVRPHQGVDYGAPSGTPISAVASGEVNFAGWSGGYGKLVVIEHSKTYTTMYAHMSRFGKGITKGAKVKQGDLVGYVGATGTATGPHLDFRLKKNGKFVDPVEELKKQEGMPLPSQERPLFTNHVTKLRNEMTSLLAAKEERQIEGWL